MSKVIFGSFEQPDDTWTMVFNQPTATYVAHSLDQIVPLLRTAESAASSGSWVALMLSYEAAPAFDHALKTHRPTGFPLAWAAVFSQSLRLQADPTPPASYELSSWEPQTTRSNYNSAIDRIRELIANGQTYQVNYTFPLRCSFRGDPESWYHSLSAAQEAAYTVYLDMGRYKVLSLSPELFFESKGSFVRAKPMKGTTKRGRWASEDEDLAVKLADSAKDRAENVMIVDLIRNDLGKVCVPGSVRVPRLYEVERYPTLWQMTSTVEATLRPELGLTELMAALFPCGSVTGAPKVNTMKIIRELEPFPRRAYTGAIGMVKPGGDCIFNVAIRTLIIDSNSGAVTFGVGGGITIDSSAEREYNECLLKSSFLESQAPIFRLLETILLEGGDLFLVTRHLRRLQSSANYFGFRFQESDALGELDQLKSKYPTGHWKVRLLLARDGKLEIEAQPLQRDDSRIARVALAGEPVRSSDRFLFHKTTNRSIYENAASSRLDCDDVLLWNERGEITESTIANVVLPKDETLWTPALSSGLLPGVFRSELLATGKIRERVIQVEELREAKSFFLINSVYRWRKATLLD